MKADKTSNLYKVPVDEYNNMLHNNVTKDYKKAKQIALDDVNKEAKEITGKMELDDRINVFKESQPFLSIKDHKDNFPKRVACRLVNPAKSNTGKISKQIIDRINKELRSELNVNQWTNTNEVIKWFHDIKDKNKKMFIKFDLDAFYPSITRQLFMEVLKWAGGIVEIAEDEIKTILNSKRSFICKNGEAWVKQNTPDFDITIGSDEGAEECEMVGLFLLEKLNEIIPKEDMGIYRDDGLSVIPDNGPNTARTVKKLHKLFNKYQLSIQAETGIKTTDFLDVILDLNTGKTKPFRKENDNPMYINTESNHPPSVIKQLPTMISSRLSGL